MTALSKKDHQRLQAARMTYLEGRASDAVKAYENLARKYPQSAPIAAELAQIYLRFGRLQLAEPLLLRLLNIGKRDHNSLLVAGRGFKQIGRNRLAITAFELALQTTDAEPETQNVWIELVALHERVNDLDSAQQALSRLKVLVPTHPQGQYMAGIVAGRMKQLEIAESSLRKAIANPLCSQLTNVQSRYALGKVLDRMQRFEEAHAMFVDAKGIELPQLREERIKALWMAELINRLTRELKSDEKSPPPSEPRGKQDSFGRPLCFLTGHPRSGTTLFEQMLTNHPQISTADESSAFFYSIVYPLVFPTIKSGAQTLKNPLPRMEWSDLTLLNVTPEKLTQQVAEYRNQLQWLGSDCNPDHYLIDKSPGGMIDLPVFEAALPRTKVIVVLRDPRDVCLSCFQQFLGVNLVSVNFNTLENTAAKIVRDLKFWLAYKKFTKLNWLEVHYEHLIQAPESELKRIIEFLGLEWKVESLDFSYRQSNRDIHSPSYSSVSEPLTHQSIGRWRNYISKFSRASEILAETAGELGYER